MDNITYIQVNMTLRIEIYAIFDHNKWYMSIIWYVYKSIWPWEWRFSLHSIIITDTINDIQVKITLKMEIRAIFDHNKWYTSIIWYIYKSIWLWEWRFSLHSVIITNTINNIHNITYIQVNMTLRMEILIAFGHNSQHYEWYTDQYNSENRDSCYIRS